MSISSPPPSGHTLGTFLLGEKGKDQGLPPPHSASHFLPQGMEVLPPEGLPEGDRKGSLSLFTTPPLPPASLSTCLVNCLPGTMFPELAFSPSPCLVWNMKSPTPSFSVLVAFHIIQEGSWRLLTGLAGPFSLWGHSCLPPPVTQ